MARVAVFAGPSGGHLFPALAFAEVFREKHPESLLWLVTGERARKFSGEMENGVFNFVIYLPDFPFPSGISLRTLRFLLQFARAFILSFRYLSTMKPDLCVGFGSYVAYPGLRIAAMKKIPVLIHEQNQVPGKATQWLVPHADGVAVAFEETLAELKPSVRAVVGLPIRSKLGRAALILKKPAAQPEFRVLIVGGSQGAHRLNKIVLESFSLLSSEEKKKIAVMHITGQADFVAVTRDYQTMNIQAKTFPFFDRMHELYTNADLAITRAGANTLFELALFKVPAVVVPYPYAGAHQKENAEFFAKRGGVVMREESVLNSAWLLAQIRIFYADLNLRTRMAEALEKLSSPDAALRLAEIAEKFLKTETTWQLSTRT